MTALLLALAILAHAAQAATPNTEPDFSDLETDVGTCEGQP